MGLYTPTILGGNSYLSWFYDRGAIKDPAHTGTSKGLSQAINRGLIRKSLPKYENVYVTLQSHGLSAGARTHYVTANGVRNGLMYLSELAARSHLPHEGRFLEHNNVGTKTCLRTFQKYNIQVELNYLENAFLTFGNIFIHFMSLYFHN